MNSYTAGALVQVSVTFANLAGTPTDPTAITLKWSVTQSANYLPGPTTTWVYPSNITRTGTGLYQARLDTTGAPGIYTVEWIGTGAVQVTQAEQFVVTPAPL